MESNHRHLSSEVMAWVGAGEVPRLAVLRLVLACWPEGDVLRAQVVVESRARLRRGDPAGYWPVAVGIAGPAEVGLPGPERFAEVVARLAARPAGERPASLRRRGRLLAQPGLFDALLVEVRRRFAEPAGEAESWVDLAEAVLPYLRGVGLPTPFLWEREVRLAACRAELLRTRGDLPAAASAFAALAADPRRPAIVNLDTHAELWLAEAALERSLLRFEVAERLLGRAAAVKAALGGTLQ